MMRPIRSFALGNRAWLGLELTSAAVGLRVACEGLPVPRRVCFVYSFTYTEAPEYEPEEEARPMALSA